MNLFVYLIPYIAYASNVYLFNIVPLHEIVSDNLLRTFLFSIFALFAFVTAKQAINTEKNIVHRSSVIDTNQYKNNVYNASKSIYYSFALFLCIDMFFTDYYLLYIFSIGVTCIYANHLSKKIVD